MGPEPLAEMRDRLSERRSSRDIRNLDRRAREMLAGVRKQEPTQRHFQDSKLWECWKGSEERHPAPAASGAREDGNWRATLLRDMPTYANPCPKTREWYHGLQHKNALRENAGKLWEPVRAIASTRSVWRARNAGS